MIKQIFSVGSFLFLSFFCFGQIDLKEALRNLPVLAENNPAQIMILGTFHFNFSENGSDIKGENNFNIYDAAKQAELKVVIEKIKQFKPTQIAVEMMVKDQAYIDSLFDVYKKGSWKPRRNEAYQLGFRIASELGLKIVHCVDTRPSQIEIDSTIDDWDEYAKSRNELQLWKAYDKPNEKANTYFESLKTKMTIAEYLIFLNDKKTKLRYKQFFLTGLVNVGAGDTYLGADLTGYWYRRNTRIFTNIKRLVKEPEERILVIYGNSHAWILEELFSASPEFNVVEVDKVLK